MEAKYHNKTSQCITSHSTGVLARKRAVCNCKGEKLPLMHTKDTGQQVRDDQRIISVLLRVHTIWHPGAIHSVQ